MATIVVDELITKLEFDISPSERLNKHLVALAVKECPACGAVEIEQCLDGVGAVRVRVEKPAE